MRIGRYRVLGRLGRGGMGVVYKAAMPVTGRIAALKLCRPAEIFLEVVGPDEARRRFLAEAVAMGRVRHPGVAQILDVDSWRDMPFFVMEYYCDNVGAVLGESDILEEPCRVLAPEKAGRYAAQTLSALARMHFEGMVHRDVKPGNLMLTDEDEVKLIDFGLARMAGQRTGGPSGAVVGSPWYAAPEQEADPDAAGPQADLFGLGVSLFRMLTGLLPMQETRAGRVNPDLGEVFDAFLERSFAPDPRDRFPDAATMLSALEERLAAWDRRKDEVCGLPPEPGSGRQTPPGPAPLPARIRPGLAREAFGLDDLWRPLRETASFEPTGRDTLLDRQAGLEWQASGSPYPLDRERGLAYVAELNAGRFAGAEGWRLPTVRELCSILRRPERPGGFCAEDLFDRTQRRLRSSDRKSYCADWYADASHGFVWWQEATCPLFVRAVRPAR